MKKRERTNEKKPPMKKSAETEEAPAEQKQPFLKRLLFGEEKPDIAELEAGSTTVLDILSPITVDTKSRDYIVVDGIFHAYLYVTGYGYSTTVGSCWLTPLVEAGEGVSLSFTFKRQPREKILSQISQTTMVNRSRMRDVGDTRQDYEKLDSAINSGLYLKDAINRQGEDFYYYCICDCCGSGYSFFSDRTPREAIIRWNQHICWEEIPTYIPDGKVDERFADIVLTDEDKAVQKYNLRIFWH